MVDLEMLDKIYFVDLKAKIVTLPSGGGGGGLLAPPIFSKFNTTPHCTF